MLRHLIELRGCSHKQRETRIIRVASRESDLLLSELRNELSDIEAPCRFRIESNYNNRVFSQIIFNLPFICNKRWKNRHTLQDNSWEIELLK